MDQQPLWVTEPREVWARVRAEQAAGKLVGLVPTMGNLHAGHQALLKRAAAETDFVVATIFVNPIQFVQGEDFETYPRTPDHDRELCAQAGVDLIFAPNAATMYPPDACTRVQVTGLEEPLCGHHRPGHFVGVATIVTKLFNIVPANLAYFGLKDYQQAKLIERLTIDLNFPMEIRLCPTVREPDGLAMSSRNQYLSPDERKQATALRRSLDLAEQRFKSGIRDPKTIRQEMVDLIRSQTGGSIDYIELLDAQSLTAVSEIRSPVVVAIAVRFGKARLIDNCVLASEG
jgi:pantoate--beta-alanine ligase